MFDILIPFETGGINMVCVTYVHVGAIMGLFSEHYEFNSAAEKGIIRLQR